MGTLVIAVGCRCMQAPTLKLRLMTEHCHSKPCVKYNILVVFRSSNHLTIKYDIANKFVS